MTLRKFPIQVGSRRCNFSNSVYSTNKAVEEFMVVFESRDVFYDAFAAVDHLFGERPLTPKFGVPTGLCRDNPA